MTRMMSCKNGRRDQTKFRHVPSAKTSGDRLWYSGQTTPLPLQLGPVLLTFFATRRKNFSQWHRSFQRKLRSHWLKFLRHVAITLVIQGPDALALCVLSTTLTMHDKRTVHCLEGGRISTTRTFWVLINDYKSKDDFMFLKMNSVREGFRRTFIQ